MNKTELIEAVAEQTKVSKKDTGAVIAATLDAIGTALKGGQKVQLIGFGTFETRQRAARTGRNPQTGKSLKIKASVVPAFKPGKALKEKVNVKTKKKK